MFSENAMLRGILCIVTGSLLAAFVLSLIQEGLK